METGSAQLMEGTPHSWSEIPLELVGLVLGRLPAHIDRVRFGAVCSQWCSAVQQVRLPPPLPLLALKDGSTFYSMPRGEPLHFAGCENGFATASGSWLLYCHLHCLLLVDPFSGATMTLPAPPRIYVPDEGDDGSEDCNDIALMDALDSKYMVMVKLIVCSPCLIAAQFRVDTVFKVAVCQPRSSSWSVLQCPFPWNTDSAFYQGKLYAITCPGYLLALNISVDDNTGDPQFVESEEIGFEVIIKGDCKTKFKIDDYNFMRMVYLVESHGSLLMVSRRIFEGHIHGKGQIQTFAEQCEPEVVVLEADFEGSRWVKVTSLGDDQVLFLGPCSRAVCMPQCDSLGKRVWLLDDYKNYHAGHKRRSRSSSGTDCNFLFDYKEPHTWEQCESSYDADGVAIDKPFSHLPMISWRGHKGLAGAAWLFPPN